MSTLVILANLGHLKVCRIEHTPNRGMKLEPVDELDFTESHGRAIDKLSDRAGRFPISEVRGVGYGMAIGEAHAAALEKERRLFHDVARQIEAELAREQPLGWHFAAPAEILPAMIEAIAPAYRESLLRQVTADLTKVPLEQVLPHFV